MSVIQSSSAIEVLTYLHVKLEKHFAELHLQRQSLIPPSPVFALEHDLGQADYRLLVASVRAAVADGLTTRHRSAWLPFVVYAAESGYDYVGDEYWTSFERSTPGWQSEYRHWIKVWFIKFAQEFGGIVPAGAFARTFTIIAWPISHAVLPTYLQRQLAQLLFEFRAGLTAALLGDLDELGERLAVRARLYSDRFRIFSQNTALLGRVAAALLSGEEEESPYLVKSTLDRLVEGLSGEQESRHWLASARQAANRVRAGGFASAQPQRKAVGGQTRQSVATDPKFFLKQFDGVWDAYAELPDMTSLSERLPHVFEDLRTLRPKANGCGKPRPRGSLVFPGQEFRFDSWPDPLRPFLQLEGGSGTVNSLLKDQSVMTKGPWWLYRTQGSGLAIEVRGRCLRPGHSYILVGTSGQASPDVSWGTRVPLRTPGAHAHRLDVPEQLTQDDADALVSLGLSVLSTITVRPVGLVASAWDGEGAAEWLAGEPAVIGIRSELIPARCLLTVDGHAQFVPWTVNNPELVLSLVGLDVGSHEVNAIVIGADDRELAKGTLTVTVRDPQVRPENASKGEGIRMLASPARPTLSALWEGRASITVDSASGVSADVIVRLRNIKGAELAMIRREVVLPVDVDQWGSLVESFRSDRSFSAAYDESESCHVEVRRDGLGMASLTFERGFQPLRWQFSKADRDGHRTAKLHDRTDGGATNVAYYSVEEPLQTLNYLNKHSISLHPRGGLLYATTGDTKLAVLAPTNPNAVVALGATRPAVQEFEKSPAGVMGYVEAHHLWATAEMPADLFAVHEQTHVLEAVARANAIMLGGSHWAAIERKLARASELADHLDEMQETIGVTASHKSLAADIGRNLYRWSEPAALVLGFDSVIAQTLVENGIKARPAAARFLLSLAGKPGLIATWPTVERDELIGHVISSPVLIRAARFAVLGVRALNDSHPVGGGF